MSDREMADRALPRSADVATGRILLAVGGYLGFVALGMIAMFFYVKADAPAAFTPPLERRFPQPSLQTSPQQDLAEILLKQRQPLSEYEWMDKSKGLARIPIDRAIDIVIARGERGYDPLAASPAPTDQTAPGAQQ
ncbi:hypothetical protein [Bradyrhizobium sp. STM 3561]|jgi:hypothetical protein|uniref:hypothetical protein n=1 Tax=Bradyrhizobium sp. STM 3561 TaxID=578923 RepID=UPI00388E538C